MGAKLHGSLTNRHAPLCELCAAMHKHRTYSSLQTCAADYLWGLLFIAHQTHGVHVPLKIANVLTVLVV
jgi:hypothetical protein